MAIKRPDAKRAELLGYSDRPSACPGENMQFMVSSEFTSYEASLVRLIHGDTNNAGPGFKEEVIESPINGVYAGTHQESHVGSHIEIKNSGVIGALRSFTVQAWIKPSKPSSSSDQGVVSSWSTNNSGFSLGLDVVGHAFVEVGSSSGLERVTSEHPLRAGVWYFIAGGFDNRTKKLVLVVHGSPRWPLSDSDMVAERNLSKNFKIDCSADLLIGAKSQKKSLKGKMATAGHFNGRIEHPRLFSRLLDTDELTELSNLADPKKFGSVFGTWDFSSNFESSEIKDLSQNRIDGVCVNYPTRALLGHFWDRETFDFRTNPSMYCAIEFHEDDNADSDWDVSVDLKIPDDLKSGIYALRLRAGDTEDHIPFFVRPRRGKTTTDICYLIPTITYQAYANESVLATSLDTDWSAMTDIEIVPDLYDTYVWDHPELAYSIYDRHSDGSGINYSSWKRPILNMRPKHRYWVTGAPRHFAADLYVTDWLEAKEHKYDILTDHDMHQDGVSSISDYKVIITGSHPEYWTEPMQNALEIYLADGGRLIYLGGNGFYWVTAVNPEQSHVIEVRRGYASSRTWTSHPAELHLASTGEKGGIWRFRGRSPNSLVGVGFAAQGWSKKAPGYKRLPDSYDSRVAFIFEGVEDKILGDFGLVMNGASGDEIDRFDYGLGTPTHAMRLATSQGLQSSYYLVTHEDLLVTDKNVDGTNNQNVRSDIVYFEGVGGSAVFSIPAMGASGSLSHNNYENNISRIMDNVVREFTK